METSLLKTNKQELADIQNSVVHQAYGDIIINHGISVQDAKDICRGVIKEELAIYTQQATGIAQQRLHEITEKAIDRILVFNQSLLQRFTEPAIQMALYETVKSHIRVGNEELEEHLIDLLIERLNVQERTIKQSVIDEARIIIPKLSSSAVALLTIIVFSQLVFPYTISKYEEFLKKLSPVISKLKNISAFDTEYLKQVGCGTGSQVITVNSTLEKALIASCELQMREPLSLDDLEKILQKYSNGEHDKTKQISSLFDMINHNHFLFKVPHQQGLNELVYNTIDKPTMTALIEDYKTSTRPFSDDEVRNYFINLNSDWKYIFKLFTERYVASLQLTPVGIYIGARQLSRICGEDIPITMFYN